MKAVIKIVGKYLLEKLDLYSLYLLRTKSFLKESGWFKSAREGVPVDIEGNPIPWMTYAVIKFLEKRIKKEKVVFEYSCGNSTLWWASRVKHLISCEHDKQWYEKIKKIIPPNVELYQLDLEWGGEYSKKVARHKGEFDIVVIDGRDRVNCAKNCLASLKKEGVIIWDNSDRDSYKEGFDYLTRNGYKRLDFEGMGPVNAISWCTSIFYKKENCLGI